MRNQIGRIATLFVILVSIAVPLWMLTSGGSHAREGFPLDDAWIHMVYARSVSQSGYLAYNPGIPSTGSTSPLWAYVLGLAHLLFPSAAGALLAAKVLGILFHVCMSLAAYRIVLLVSGSWPIALISGILLGTSPPLAASAISGMEVSMGCALALTGLYLYFRNKWLPAGIFFGLCGLTRPEFAALILVVWCDAARGFLREKRPWRELVPLLLPPLIAGSLFMGWNLFANGRILTSSFYAKVVPQVATGFITRIGSGLRIIMKDSPLAGGLVWAGLLAPFLFKVREKRKIAVCFAGGVIYFLGNILVILPLDTSAYYYIRYLLPSMALLSVAVLAGWAAGSRAFIEKLTQASPKAVPLWKVAGSAVLGITALLLMISLSSGVVQWRLKYARDCRNIDEVQVALGKDIDRAFPPSAKIGTTDAGAINYFGGRFTVDLLGINTKEKLGETWNSPPLDAIVVFPAWVKVQKENTLAVVDEKTTADYRVTRNPSMGTQVTIVCRSEKGEKVRDLRLTMLGVRASVRLNTMTGDEIDALKKRLREPSR